MSKEVLVMEARLKNYMSAEIKKIQKDMQKLDKKSRKNTSNISKGFDEAKKSLMSFVKGFGVGFVVTIALTKAVQALGQGIQFVKEKTETFEAVMSKIKAVLRPTTEEMISLDNAATKLGEDTIASASQVGEAFVEMGKLGQKSSEILKSAEGVLNLAALAETNMANASAVTIKTLNQFGYAASETNRVVDVMALSFNSSALDLEKYSNAMQYAGTVGAETGEEIEVITGALSILADRSIDASMAGTSLRRIMLELADSNSKASKKIKEIDETATSFTEKLRVLKDANMDMTEATEMFGLISVTAAKVLIGNVDNVESLTEAYKNADGTAKKFADTMLDNVLGATKLLESAQESLAKEIGNAFGQDKQDRIEFYIELIKSATQTIKDHKNEIRFLGKIFDFTFRNIAIMFHGLKVMVVGTMDAIILTFHGWRLQIANVKIAIDQLITKMSGGLFKIDSTKTIANIKEIEKQIAKTIENMAVLTGFKVPASRNGGDDNEAKRIGKSKKTTKSKSSEEKNKTVSEEEQKKIDNRKKGLEAIARLDNIAYQNLIEANISYFNNVESLKIDAWTSDSAKLKIKHAADIAVLANKQTKEIEMFRGSSVGMESVIASHYLVRKELDDNYTAGKNAILQREINADLMAKQQLTEAQQLFEETLRASTLTDAQLAFENKNTILEQEIALLETKKTRELEIFEGTAAGKKSISEKYDNIINAKIIKHEKFKSDTIKKGAKEGLDDLVKNLKSMAKENKNAMVAYKAAAIGQATIDTYKSATGAYSAMSGIAIVGPALGAIAAAVAIAAGMSNVKKIATQKFRDGGVVGGNSLTGDNVSANVNSKEMILTRGQQSELFQIANGNGKTTNSSNVVVNFVIPDNANITDAGAESITQSINSIGDVLLEADRGGLLDDFKQQFAQVEG